jgi:hypothetical protein
VRPRELFTIDNELIDYCQLPGNLISICYDKPQASTDSFDAEFICGVFVE